MSKTFIISSIIAAVIMTACGNSSKTTDDGYEVPQQVADNFTETYYNTLDPEQLYQYCNDIGKVKVRRYFTKPEQADQHLWDSLMKAYRETDIDFISMPNDSLSQQPHGYTAYYMVWQQMDTTSKTASWVYLEMDEKGDWLVESFEMNKP